MSSPSLLHRFLSGLRGIVPSRDYVLYRDCVLPPRRMRRRFGPDYASAEFFLESGSAEARRLVTKLAFTKNSNLVDIGCGLGRLATGLLREVGDDVQYWGFDVVMPWITWCKEHIERSHPSFRFVHIDVANEAYNPDGAVRVEDLRFPLDDGHADIVNMWGVFTNMRLNDARIYVSEISRLVRDGGSVFLTAFVEENVPAESINPDNYVDYECKYLLHVARYEKELLFSIFAEHGLTVEEFAYHQGYHCNQSDIYLRKAKRQV